MALNSRTLRCNAGKDFWNRRASIRYARCFLFWDWRVNPLEMQEFRR